MSNGSDDGRTFLDNLFDKADEVMSGLERIKDGNKGVIPMEFDDGRRVIADSIAGGQESTDGEPDWIVLSFINRDGKETKRRYRRDPVSSGGGRVIDIGGGK